MQERKIADSVIESKEQALEVINEFFVVFHPVEAREGIREIQEAVGLCKVASLSGERKEELIYLSEKLEALITAAYRLRNN